MIRAGAQLRISDTGEVVTVWCAAPAPGTYWVHLDGRVVLVGVRQASNALEPVVTILEETA